MTLDPVHGSYTLYPGGSEAALCIYDGLLTFAPDMKIIPQLAESWTMADGPALLHAEAARRCEVP